MTPPQDTHSLLSWLIDQELKAHNNAAKHHGFTKGLEYAAEEKAYKRVIDKIRNGRVGQRPHVREDI